MMCIGCIASSLDDDWLLVRLSLVGHAWSPDFVILGGTHMESRFCHSSSAVESTVREGFGASCLVYG